MNFSFKCNLLYPETDFQKTIFLTPKLNLLGDNTSLAQAVYVGSFLPSMFCIPKLLNLLIYLTDSQTTLMKSLFSLTWNFLHCSLTTCSIFGAKVALKNQLLPLNMLLTGKDTYLPNLEKRNYPTKLQVTQK